MFHASSNTLSSLSSQVFLLSPALTLNTSLKKKKTQGPIHKFEKASFTYKHLYVYRSLFICKSNIFLFLTIHGIQKERISMKSSICSNDTQQKCKQNTQLSMSGPKARQYHFHQKVHLHLNFSYKKSHFLTPPQSI